MKVIGKTIWQMDMEYIFIVEVQDMKGNGKMIYKMAKVLRFGQIMQNMREIT